jgi:integrase
LPANTHKRFAAVTDPKRLGEVLAAFDSYAEGSVVKAALQLQPLLFARPSELRLAQWHEFNLKKGLFTVPSSRMKRTLQAKLEGEPHLVPLSTRLAASERPRRRARMRLAVRRLTAEDISAQRATSPREALPARPVGNLKRLIFNFRRRIHRQQGLRVHHALDDARVKRLILTR